MKNMHHRKGKNNVELDKLFDILPTTIRLVVDDPDRLLEIVMDLGRPLILKYTTGKKRFDNYIISQKDIDQLENNLGDFGPDNRAGLDGTIHRLSRIKSRSGHTVGFTVRIGKTVEGAADLIKDIAEAGENILVVGSPGKGKSTILRGLAHHISTTTDLSVVIVDSSNEIAGDGDIPHPSVGDSRRLQVPFKLDQHVVMIEAVENHCPDVIIIDEISSDLESKAARTIAQRGVQLIATAHGDNLQSIMENPPLSPLIGNTKVAAVSDKAAEKTGNKFITERVSKPVFTTVIEIKSFNEVWVYNNVADVIDLTLSGGEYTPEKRLKRDDEFLIIPDSIKEFVPSDTSIASAFDKAQQPRLSIAERQEQRRLRDEQPRSGKKSWQRRRGGR